MKILITGSRGFVGSCLGAVLTNLGHKVTGLDNFSRGLNDFPTIKFDCLNGIKHILNEFTYIDSAPPFHCVVHLAAGTGSLDRPYNELVELNIEMTKRVYNDSVQAGIPVFVFPTTSLIEGENCENAPYVKSKANAMSWLLAQEQPTKLVPLQFYNLVGAVENFSEHRLREVHVIPTLLASYMANEEFIVNGDDYDTDDGSPGRDYSNVKDVCKAIIDLIYVQFKHPFHINAPIKLGTGKVTTTLRMIDLFDSFMEPLFDRKLKWKFGPRRAYDCGWLKCNQPYLNILGGITPIKDSLEDELRALLKVVYKKDVTRKED